MKTVKKNLLYLIALMKNNVINFIKLHNFVMSLVKDITKIRCFNNYMNYLAKRSILDVAAVLDPPLQFTYYEG